MFLQGIKNSQTPQSPSNLLQKSLGIPSSSSHPGGMCLLGSFPFQLCQSEDYTCTLGMSGVGLDFPLGFGRQPRLPPKREKKKRNRKTSPRGTCVSFVQAWVMRGGGEHGVSPEVWRLGRDFSVLVKENLPQRSGKKKEKSKKRWKLQRSGSLSTTKDTKPEQPHHPLPPAPGVWLR